jgi:parallel beta-helix repeat protein
MKNRVAFIVTIFFLELVFTSTVSASQFEELSDSFLFRNYDGNILYVGGSGPENYSKIQDAVDNSSVGDTIFVYNRSSPYYENIIIIKNNIKLVGENKYCTIVDGNDIGHVIEINADNVTLEGFTVQHSGPIEEFEFDAGVHIMYMSHYVIITDNIIVNNQHGIFIDGCQNSIVSKNIISNNIEGIIIYGDARYNIISENKIENNTNGIHEAFTSYSIIIGNNIVNNTGVGIICSYTTFHITKKNNFINNSCHAYFDGRFKYFSERNLWIRNYWDTWIGFGPKLIKGRVYIPWINFDWFPAYKPYIISNYD